MSIVKRVKLKEAIDQYNFKNKLKGKIRYKELMQVVNNPISVSNLSNWNSGKVPKAICVLGEISKDLDYPISKLISFNIVGGKKIVTSIDFSNGIKHWNKNNISKKNLSYLHENLISSYKSYTWRKGLVIPPTIKTFFDICDYLEVDFNEILEFNN